MTETHVVSRVLARRSGWEAAWAAGHDSHVRAKQIEHDDLGGKQRGVHAVGRKNKQRGLLSRAVRSPAY